jgi:hypothetical protein
MAGSGQLNAELRAFLGEEAMGNLNQRSAAVAKAGIEAGGAAMVEIGENLQALDQNVVGLAVLQIGDEGDAAGIVLVARVVKSLRRRQSGIDHGGGSKKRGMGGGRARPALGRARRVAALAWAQSLVGHLPAPWCGRNFPGRLSSNCAGVFLR